MPQKIWIAFLAITLGATLAWAAGKVHVVVKQTSIRSENQFFAPTIATVKRMDELEAIAAKDGWIKVSHNGKTGWIHNSAVSGDAPKEKKKKGGFSLFGKKDDPAEVSQDEVTLAGKGFNEKVEDEYKKKNPELNFEAVDKMEKITVEERKLAAFVKEGRLQGRRLEK